MSFKPFTIEKPRYRQARFAQRVREELVALIPGGLKDPRLEGIPFITITNIEITPNLRHCTVQFALMNYNTEEKRIKEVIAALNQASGFLRRELMYKMDTKVTPHLIFKFDRGFENITQVQTLLKKIPHAE